MKRVSALALLASIAMCVAAWAGVAAAESEEAGAELQNYFSNAHTTGGQGFVNVTAPLEGDQTARSPVVREGEICAMIYVFDTDQALQACCGCPVTADALLTLSITQNLAPNPTATGQLLQDGSIRILSTFQNATSVGVPPSEIPPFEGCDSRTGICCDPTANGGSAVLTPANELAAWGTHVQDTQITEQNFQVSVPLLLDPPPPPAPDFDQLPVACANIVELGSGQGVCTCGSAVS